MTLGERIYAQRAARNLPQAALAEALGVSRQSVSKWETDASVPDLDKLVGLCELFEISMDELVRGEEPAEEAPPPEETPPPAAAETRPVRNPLTVRVAVGLGLIFLGALVFVLFWPLLTGLEIGRGAGGIDFGLALPALRGGLFGL